MEITKMIAGTAKVQLVIHEKSEYQTQIQYLIFGEKQETPRHSIRENITRWKANKFVVYTFATASTQHFETLNEALQFAIESTK